MANEITYFFQCCQNVLFVGFFFFLKIIFDRNRKKPRGKSMVIKMRGGGRKEGEEQHNGEMGLSWLRKTTRAWRMNSKR